MVATVGQDPQAGIARYTFDSLYLWNGLDLVPVLIGIFAIPEIVDLIVRGTSIAGDLPRDRLSRGALEGVKDTFRHFWLTIRCSLIGTFIGILPGLGGAVAQWLAYGHAAQSARTAEERQGFGRGDVRGVLGPGAANNSKEGGSLIPTVAFGVPGSSSMAILLGGFFLLGLVPGPDMLTTHLAVTFSMVWTIVLANITCLTPKSRDGVRSSRRAPFGVRASAASARSFAVAAAAMLPRLTPGVGAGAFFFAVGAGFVFFLAGSAAAGTARSPVTRMAMSARIRS